MDIMGRTDTLPEFDASGLPRAESPSAETAHSNLRRDVSDYIAGIKFVAKAIVMVPIDLMHDATH